jgi:hypothetical protein
VEFVSVRFRDAVREIRIPWRRLSGFPRNEPQNFLKLFRRNLERKGNERPEMNFSRARWSPASAGRKGGTMRSQGRPKQEKEN